MNNESKKVKFYAALAGAVILPIAIIVVGLLTARHIKQQDELSRQYSGDEVNPATILCFDVSLLDEYKVIETTNTNEGCYTEYITVNGGTVDVRINKDFTRPNMSLKKQAAELYPELTQYKNQKPPKSELIDECGCFNLKTDERESWHRIYLFRRDGWDYRVDFSVSEETKATYEEYIDKLVESMFYI